MPEEALQAAFEIKTACDEISRRLLRWHWEQKPGAHSLDALLKHLAQRQKESPDYYDRMPDLRVILLQLTGLERRARIALFQALDGLVEEEAAKWPWCWWRRWCWAWWSGLSVWACLQNNAGKTKKEQPE